jgi:hypothetical protein
LPRATSKYGFEWKILQWASSLSRTFTGHPHFPFLVLMNTDGVADRLVFGSGPEQHDEAHWRQLQDTAPAWMAYDPFEGPVYQYLSWKGIDQRTVERLIGTSLLPQDFTAAGVTIAFPENWGVMF